MPDLLTRRERLRLDCLNQARQLGVPLHGDSPEHLERLLMERAERIEAWILAADNNRGH